MTYKALLGSVAAMAVLSTASARAADVIVEQEPAPPVSSAPVTNWNGFYVGLHGGYAWSGVDGLHDQDDTEGPYDFSNMDLDHGLFGVEAGYNFMMNNFVIGVEGDYSWADASDSDIGPDSGINRYKVERGDLWSVRARLGYLATPEFLIYGTAGWGGTEFSLRVTDETGPATGSISSNEHGGVYGAGFEWAFYQNMTFKMDYLYYDVGTDYRLNNPPIPDSDIGDSIKFDDVSVLRAAITYRF